MKRYIFTLGLMLSSIVYAGGSEVGNPWPWGVEPNIILHGDKAQFLVDQLMDMDPLFARRLSLGSSECAGGPIWNPSDYRGMVFHEIDGQRVGFHLSSLQAKILCETLIEIGVKGFEPPTPSGELYMRTNNIQCSMIDGPLCSIWLY